MRTAGQVSPKSKIVIATSENQVPSIKNQLSDNVNIFVEPCRRDTFPAIALATAFFHDVLGVSSEENIVVCPVDPLVDDSYFNTLLKMFKVAGKKTYLNGY